MHDELEIAKFNCDPDRLRCLGIRCARESIDIPTDAVVSTSIDGNYTLASVVIGGMTFLGIAKRNPADMRNARRGAFLAVQRATDKYIAMIKSMIEPDRQDATTGCSFCSCAPSAHAGLGTVR